ncbi:MATE family efflux transporter [Ruminococcaceae bacterium OttesenSCG-928-O06]|nr:MATE family efflux transporter [Ruminococcaceae bacterium OttesenSCG-928-O06]
MSAKQTDFSKGSVSRAVLEVGLPLTVAQLLNLLYNIVDRIYIGRIPGAGAIALTGVGLCFPIILIVNAFSSLYATGGSPLATIMRGKGNNEEAHSILGTCFVMLVGTGLVLTVLGLALHQPILYLFGASDATFPYARDYITIYLFGSVAVMITLGMNPFINSQGFPKMGMLTVLLGAVTNIILDPIFIFTLGMGVRGAALATVLSQLLSCVWVLRFLTSQRAVLRLRRRDFRVQSARLFKIVSLGLTGFVMQVTNSLVQIACNTTLQTFGGDIYVGVMTVLNSVREIFTLPVMGLVNGSSPVISYNYGAGLYPRVKQAIRFTFTVTAAYTLVAWGVVYLFPAFFINIFNNDAELVSRAVPALRIYFFAFVFMAMQFVGQTSFVALGKSKQAVFFSIFRKVVIVVPLTLLLPRLTGLGVNGVFVAEPISNVIGGSLCFFTMLATVMPELRRLQAEKDAAAPGAPQQPAEE